MKLTLLFSSILLGLLLFPGFAPSAAGQSLPEPRQSPLGLSRVMLDDDSYVKIVYGRPQMRGREVFGQLVPYGEVWRTGANEATEITLAQPIRVEGELLEAGTYSVFSIPQEESWTIIFNEQLGAWGAYSYDEAADVMRAEVPVERIQEPAEAFTIMFEQEENAQEAHLVMQWETTRVQLLLQPAD